MIKYLGVNLTIKSSNRILIIQQVTNKQWLFFFLVAVIIDV